MKLLYKTHDNTYMSAGDTWEQAYARLFHIVGHTDKNAVLDWAFAMLGGRENKRIANAMKEELKKVKSTFAIG